MRQRFLKVIHIPCCMARCTYLFFTFFQPYNASFLFSYFSYILHFYQAFMSTKLTIFFRASQLIEPFISCQQTILYPMATNVILIIPLLIPPFILSFLMSSNVSPYQPPPFQIVSFLITMMPPPSTHVKNCMVSLILHKPKIVPNITNF